MDADDPWNRLAPTLDWVAALVAARLQREPATLVWPGIALGLVAGLSAEAVAALAGGAPRAVTLVGVALTVSAFGMLALVAVRLRGGRSGAGRRTADAALLGEWLRRLQLLLAVVLVAVVGLAVLGAAIGSALLVGRNVLEVGRVGAVVLVVSLLLMDDEVGLPDWLGRRAPAPVDDPGPAA